MYLDSNFRSDQNDPPTNYIISVGQGNLWSALPKDVNDGISSWSKTIVEVLDITMETFYIYPRPIIKFNIVDLVQFDTSTVNSLDPSDSFRFSLNEHYNNFGWRKYNCDFKVPMKFKSKSTYKIELTDMNNVYPIDVTRTIITLKLTPIERFNIKYKDITFKEESLKYYNKHHMG